MGKLIVFEGVDGSGKSTQYRRLCERLSAAGIAFRSLVFPRYQNDSSALLRMYLNGDFGTDPQSVNAYAASSFFAVDRYASYRQDWGEWYEAGGLVVTDRYTTSNAVHQAAKLPSSEREAFIRWLFDYEYRLLGLPEPDLVLFCDISADLSQQHLRQREAATHTVADIHENSSAYLRASVEAARQAAALFGWTAIPCGTLSRPRTIQEIGAEIDLAVEGICRI